MPEHKDTLASRLIELACVFFPLGCIAFGGPAAHLAYFRRVFVDEKRWISSDDYAGFVALSQFLPGPGSSQVGFSIGLQRAGLCGGLVAFIAFTLPAFILMLCAAVFSLHFSDSPLASSVIYGLKLLAVVVVVHATISMARQFSHGLIASLMTICSALVLLATTSGLTQFVIIAVSGVVGCVVLRDASRSDPVAGQSFTKQPGAKLGRGLIFATWPWLARYSLMAFLVCLFLSSMPLLPLEFSAFYQAGSAVFGGGHVVLPLLEQVVVGESGGMDTANALSKDQFLLGYSLAQAIPGPMFTFATFLGASLSPGAPVLGAIFATVGVFLPGFLLVLSFRDIWQGLIRHPRVFGFVAGVNASVVGLLAAVLYSPVATSAVHSWWDVGFVGVGMIVLFKVRQGIWMTIGLSVIYGLVSGYWLQAI